MDFRDLNQSFDKLHQMSQQQHQMNLRDQQAKEVAPDDPEKQALLKADKLNPNLVQREHEMLLAKRYREGQQGSQATQPAASLRSGTSFYGTEQALSPSEYEQSKMQIQSSMLPKEQKEAFTNELDARYKRQLNDEKAVEVIDAFADYALDDSIHLPFAGEKLSRANAAFQANAQSGMKLNPSFHSAKENAPYAIAAAENARGVPFSPAERKVLTGVVSGDYTQLKGMNAAERRDFITLAIAAEENPEAFVPYEEASDEQKALLSYLAPTPFNLGGYLAANIAGIADKATFGIAAAAINRVRAEMKSYELFPEYTPDQVEGLLEGVPEAERQQVIMDHLDNLHKQRAAAMYEVMGDLSSKPFLEDVTGVHNRLVGNAVGYVTSVVLPAARIFKALGLPLGAAALGGAAAGTTVASSAGGAIAKSVAEKRTGQELTPKQEAGASAIGHAVGGAAFMTMAHFGGMGAIRKVASNKGTPRAKLEAKEPFTLDVTAGGKAAAYETILDEAVGYSTTSTLKEDTIGSLVQMKDLDASVTKEILNLAKQHVAETDVFIEKMYGGKEPKMQEIIAEQVTNIKNPTQAAIKHFEALRNQKATLQNEVASMQNNFDELPVERQVELTKKQQQIAQADYDLHIAGQALHNALVVSKDQVNLNLQSKLFLPNSAGVDGVIAMAAEQLTTGQPLTTVQLSANELADDFNTNLETYSQPYKVAQSKALEKYAKEKRQHYEKQKKKMLDEMEAEKISFERRVEKAQVAKQKALEAEAKEIFEKEKETAKAHNKALPTVNKGIARDRLDEAFPNTTHEDFANDEQGFSLSIREDIVSNLKQARAKEKQLYEAFNQKANDIFLPAEQEAALITGLAEYVESLPPGRTKDKSERILKRTENYHEEQAPLTVRDAAELQKGVNEEIEMQYVSGNRDGRLLPMVGVIRGVIQNTLILADPSALKAYKAANQHHAIEVMDKFYNEEITPWLKKDRKDFQSEFNKIKNASQLQALQEVLSKKAKEAATRVVLGKNLEPTISGEKDPKEVISNFKRQLAEREIVALNKLDYAKPVAIPEYVPPNGSLPMLSAEEMPPFNYLPAEAEQFPEFTPVDKEKFQITGKQALGMMQTIEGMKMLKEAYGDNPVFTTLLEEVIAGKLTHRTTPVSTKEVALLGRKRSYTFGKKSDWNRIMYNAKRADNKAYITEAFGKKGYTKLISKLEGLESMTKKDTVQVLWQAGAQLGVEVVPFVGRLGSASKQVVKALIYSIGKGAKTKKKRSNPEPD